MKYINVHLTESEYKEFLLTNIYWPHVDYTQDDLVSHFDPEKPENKWLTFTALEDCVLSLTNYGYNTPSLEYSIDDGVHWYTWDYTPFHLSPYASVAIRGTNPYGVCSSDEMYSTFSCTGQYTCTGNIAYLLNTEEALDEIPSEYCFYKLFAGSSTLISGPELRPSIIKAHCYESLFEDCSSMITAPSLPATKTAEACYKALFKGCSSITSYGKLPAKKVDVSAYESMFEDCTGLETAPVLRATSVSNSSCKRMFAGCNNPLFTNAPELLPSTLVTDCYREMFYNCSNLNWMKVQATNISPYVHGSALFTEDWLYGVASEGDFYRHVSENDWLIDDPSGIPVNWEEHPPLYLKFILDTTTNATGTVKYSNFGGNTVVLDYSTDRGRTWTTNWQPDTPITYSDRLYVRGLNYAGFSRSLTKYSQFATTGNCSVSGTLQSLIAYNEYQYTALEYSFVNCFKGCSSITNAEKLTFDVTKVKDYAYYHCFDGTGIANIPEFPETLLSRSCYEGMFANCEGLTSISRATVSESRPVQACFKDMFAGCTNLESVPSTFLPADSLATSCYEGMFRQCEALLVSPELNALSLAPSCYQNMFCDCTSLVITPDLPAAVLVESCYATMFQGCNALTTIQAETLQFTKAAQLSCFRMFFNCEGFIDLSDVTLPCTSLAAECYEGMFSTSSNLQKAPLLPAPTLVNKCYEAMFSGCTSLIQAPVLAATRAADSCYKNMFYNCTALIDPPTMGLQFTAAYCCDHMFYNCTSLKKSPYLAPETLINGCYQYMFQKCSSLEYITCKAKNNYGIGYEVNTLNWMSECKNGGTFERVQTSHNWSCGVSNVKETWTVTPHLYCAIGTQVKTGNADYVASASKLFKFKKYDNPTFSINFQYSIDGGTWTDGVIETEYSFTKSIAFRGINMDGLMQQGVGYATTHTGLQLWGDLRGMCEYTQEVIELASTARYMPFIYMFGNNATLENIDYFHAYFTKLRSGQYSSMFVRATAITSVPSTLFPAETTAYSSGAYRSLFSGCSNLTTIPDDIFRNKESHFGQYEYMFLNCVKLVLPTTLHFHTGITDAGQNEYSHCFDGCSAITSIPDDLFTPHTTLASNCYEYMFYGCGITSLNAVLPSTTLATKCYFHMFENCKSLTSINQLMLPASTFNQTHSYMYAYMFAGCIKLSTFTSDLLPSSRMSTGCYSHMFQGCNALTDLSGVAFPCHSTESNCYEYMFQGCTGLTHTPAISISAVTEEVAYAATNTSQYACQYMFANCSKLNHPERIQISTTPGTWMCYRMFQGCNALTTNVPYLRFANCNESCCEEMFQGCGLLSKIVDLNTQVIHATNCYKHMYKDCLSLVDLTAHTISGTKPATYSCRGMFKGCTGLKKSPTFSMSTLKDGVTNTHCYAELFYNCIILEYINCQAVEGIKFSENNCDDWTYGITIANGTFERAQAASDWIMNPEPTNTTTPDAIPFSWNVTPPLWICFTKPGTNAEVSWSFTRTGTPAGVNFSYSVGGDWATAAAETTYTGTNYVLVRGYNTGGIGKNASNYGRFITTATSVSGMLSSLLNTNATVTTLPNAYCFYSLFSGCTTITNVENLYLDAPILSDYCYRSLFYGCTQLNTLPNISLITTTSAHCFNQFMQNCTALITIPSTYLSNLEVKNGIYENMFYGCNQLTTLPALPSTTLDVNCYRAMFAGCTSLIDISSLSLPAETAANYCYAYMFSSCNKITTLSMSLLDHCTTLAEGCYQHMFDGCSGITDLKTFSLPASKMEDSCYSYMFRNTKLANDKLPTLSSKLMANSCYGGMFESISTLTDISTTFSFPAGITLASSCFGAMFYGCSNLVSVNADLLKDCSTLETSCYHYMFSGCSKLTTVLNLPATTMKENCYYRMFYNCPALTTCPTLPANVLAKGCYREMFRGCTGLLSDVTHKEPTLNATVLYPQCYYQMFYGCSKLTAATVMATTSFEHTSTADCPTYQMFKNITTEGLLTCDDSHDTDWSTDDLYGSVPTMWAINLELIITPATSNDTVVFTPRNTSYNWKYRKDSQTVWTEMSGSSVSTTERLHLKGRDTSAPCPDSAPTAGCFGTTGKFTVTGTLAAMVKGTIPAGAFWGLFYGSQCTSCETLKLPKALTKDVCYALFQNCSALTTSFNDSVLEVIETVGNNGLRNAFSGCTTLDTVSSKFTKLTSVGEYGLAGLFNGCSTFTTLTNFDLPATTVGQYAYNDTFKNCAKLNYDFSSKVIASPSSNPCNKGLYYAMFYGCKALTKAPKFAYNGYGVTRLFSSTFYGCEALTTLPANCINVITTAKDNENDTSYLFSHTFYGCKALTSAANVHFSLTNRTMTGTFEHMFDSCSSLTTAPDSLCSSDVCRFNMVSGTYGCAYMFNSCSKLSSAVKPCVSMVDGGTGCLQNAFDHAFCGCAALTSVDFCWGSDCTFDSSACTSMFANCTSLKTLSASYNYTANIVASATNVFDYFLYGCKLLETAVVNLKPTNALGNYSMFRMFSGCEKLTTITGFTDIASTSYGNYACSYTFAGCLVLTTFVRYSDSITAVNQNGMAGMYYNCQKINPSSTDLKKLAATTLGTGCYDYMFYQCKSMTNCVPSIAGTSLPQDACRYMFQNCTAITKGTPTISATTLGLRSMQCMFAGCTSMTECFRTTFGVTTLGESCMDATFSGCSALVSGPATLGATTLVTNCYLNLFYNCTKLNYVLTLGAITTDLAANYSTYMSNWMYGVKGYGTGQIKCSGSDNGLLFGPNGCPVGWVHPFACTFYSNPAGAAPNVSIPAPASGITWSSKYCYATATSSSNTWTASTSSVSVTSQMLAIKMTASSKWTNSSNIRTISGTFTHVTGLCSGTSSGRSLGGYPVYGMFKNCTSLKDASRLYVDTYPSTTNEMREMFYGCTALEQPPQVSPNSFSVGNYGLYYAFYNCQKLTSFPSGFTSFTGVGTEGCRMAFYNCKSISTLGGLSISGTVKANGCDQMFDGCTSATQLPGVNCTAGYNYSFSYFCHNCPAATSMNGGKFTWVPYGDSISYGMYACQYAFSGCTKLLGTFDVTFNGNNQGGSYSFRYMLEGVKGSGGLYVYCRASDGDHWPSNSDVGKQWQQMLLNAGNSSYWSHLYTPSTSHDDAWKSSESWGLAFRSADWKLNS